MTIFVEIRRLFNGFGICRYFHSARLSPLGSKRVNVGIFWDLHKKPASSRFKTPCDAATRLKTAMMEYGYVKHMIAFFNQRSFKYVPFEVELEWKRRNQVGGKGLVKLLVPYRCGFCKRRFYSKEKLTYHFKAHEYDHNKCLKRIESVKGRRMVYMIASLSMKMDKYRKAARDILSLNTSDGLDGELKRAGFWVRTVSDEPQAASIALKNCMVDMIDKKLIDIVVLVSEDYDFAEVLKKAKDHRLRIVVVNDSKEGGLKRMADAAFSWQDVMVGKAKTQGLKVIERWKDLDILERLEWTYKPNIGRRENYHSDDDDQQREGGRPWWKLDSRSDSEERKHEPDETKSTGRSV